MPPAIIQECKSLEPFLGRKARTAFDETLDRIPFRGGRDKVGLLQLPGTLKLITKVDPARELAQSVGRRIQFARFQRGWTQMELAKASGILRPNISRLEAGRHDLRLSTVSRVAAALGLDVDWLIKPWEPSREDLAELSALTEEGLADHLSALEEIEEGRG